MSFLRRPRAIASGLSAAATLLSVLHGGTQPILVAGPAAPSAPFFGTLATDPAHAQVEADAGITVAMVELNWARYEPARGVFDAGYAAELQARTAALRAAGLRVTLALGLGWAPAWAFDLPDSRFRDQDGRVADEINLVFNQRLRTEVDSYLARVDDDLDLQTFWAVRLTSGGNGEVLYPGGGSYWAFDANAQNGAGRPASMAANPYPGWRPGTGSLSAAQVGRWADWYVRALDDTVDWQMRRLSGLGFRGYFQLLTPGSGTRPDGFARDVANNLPDGVTGVGAVWDRFYAFLPDKRNVVAYVSSLADRSGGDDACLAADADVTLDSPLANGWSATRWITRVAREQGLLVAGENPGWNQPASMNPHYLDTSSGGMLAGALRQATSCHLQGMYWAHDDKIWDGTVPLARYVAAIEQAAAGGSARPEFPVDGARTSVDDATTGAGTGEFAFTGTWGHCAGCGDGGLFRAGTSWSRTPGDTVTVAFVGTRISVYGERDPRHGRAWVAVDGAGNAVDYYGPHRREGRRMWTSRELPYGRHVLTVRVWGRHDAAATDALVSVDRVVVTGAAP